MKHLIISLFTVLLISGPCISQTKSVPISDMLESSLASVITVGVFKTESWNVLLGFRGEMDDEAYRRMLDLTGSQASGSGFVIEKNGKKYVVTNAHVIESASREPKSVFVYSISRQKYEVRIVGGDSFYDIAVLEFVDPPGAEIQSVRFTKDVPRIGEAVYAIGNPLGEFPYSVSDGIISAKNRVRNIGPTGKFGFIQTTATIIWGNSGGPLINLKGEVVGINTQLHIHYLPGAAQAFIQPQINFALESAIAEKIVDDILGNKGLVIRAWLGMEFSRNSVFDRYSKTYRPSDSLTVLSGVIPGSPAAAQLKAHIGSAIVEVNGNPVTSPEDILGFLEKVKPGEKVSFGFLNRGGNKTPGSIISGSLSTENLEQIANYVFSDPQNNLVVTERGVSIRVSNLLCNIIAAGNYKDQNDNMMWRTGKLSDLGAALRIGGLNGIIHLVVFNPARQEAELIHKKLSGSEQVQRATLWY
jgi:S1-C subfamily serine protease